ncbi:hypothetical protein QCA50_009561 [Cerrena zonata]|uniref:CREG-like beta-barrel domain-containing protein n=1 Tax=Cerrena zonata TaxID=2478898 RepID=A0AAW0GBU4_9APHY
MQRNQSPPWLLSTLLITLHFQVRGFHHHVLRDVGSTLSCHLSLLGQPFSLQEYYASCHSNGSLTLLFLPISRHSQNILHSPTSSASLSIGSDHPTASRPRVALIGNVTVFSSLEETPDRDEIEACYITKHPDARWWLPGPREPHVAYWARFDPHTIYFVGGFGDRHYIGYIPLETYQKAIPTGPTSHLHVQDIDNYPEML